MFCIFLQYYGTVVTILTIGQCYLPQQKYILLFIKAVFHCSRLVRFVRAGGANMFQLLL